MVQILYVEEGIWVLEENGINILSKDSIRFGISKQERKFLYHQLRVAAQLLKWGEPLDFLVSQGLLKKLERAPGTQRHEVWETRDPGRGGRLIFIMLKPNLIIVSAVSKSKGSLTQAIHRGINRWEEYLKNQKE